MPAFTAVPTAAAVCAAGAVPVFVDVDPDTATLDAPAAPRPRSPNARAPIVPVHLYGRPAAIPDLGVPVVEDAAQAHGALDPPRGLRGRGVQLLPDEEPRWHQRRRRGGHRRRRARRDAPAPARPRPHATTTCTRVVVDERAAVGGRRGGAARRAAAARRPTTAAGGRSRRATARRRRDLRWQADHPSATCTTCASPGSPTATPFGPGSRSTPGCTTRARSPSSPPTEQFVRAPCPEAEAMGGRVRIVPVLPRDDRRRDRGGVSSDPVNPAVEAVSAFFPCYNDEATIARMVEVAVATIERGRGRRRRGHRRQRRVHRRFGRGARRPDDHASRSCASSPTTRNRGLRRRAAVGVRGVDERQWVFYTDGDGQFDPAELELLVQRASDDVDVVQGYKLRRADGCCAR